MAEIINVENKSMTSRFMEHASRAKAGMDSRGNPGKYAVASYMEHLQDCYDCPTLGFLVKKEYYNSSSISFPSRYVRNKNMIEYEPEVMEMQAKIQKRLSELYPRTKYIRRYIINDGRLGLYYVKQSRGFNFWDKLNIYAKIFVKKYLRFGK